MPKTWGWSEDNVSLTALRQRQYQPSNGIDVPDRLNVSATSQTNGALRISFFTPTRTLTVSNFSVICASAGTDSGGTTVRKLGLYTVNAAHTQVTCVARSANDTALGTANNTIYNKAFTSEAGYSSSYTLLAGTTYGVGWLFYNTGGTFSGPSMTGWNTNGAAHASNQSLLPMLVGANFSQTDVTNTPFSIADLSSGTGPFMRLT